MNDNQWLKETIARGFQRLVALGVGNPPKTEDDMRVRVEMWVDIISDALGNPTKELDQWRLVDAFKRLFRECEFFPVPAHLIKAMPPRKTPRAPELEYLNFPRTNEEKAEGRRKIREILSAIGENVTLN